MARPVKFLASANIRLLHLLMMGPNTPLSQSSLLASAAQSPETLHHYTGESDAFRLAAQLAEKLALNHPFQDGNKRTSLYAADVFLRTNGYGLARGDLDQVQSIADAQVSVVTGQWDSQKLASFYRSVSRRLD